MSTNVDNRIVSMSFDNKDFERNIRQSMDSLDKLDRSLELDGASDGLDAVSKSMQDVANNTAMLVQRFSVLGEEVHGFWKGIIDNVFNQISNLSHKVAGTIYEMSDLGQYGVGFSKYEQEVASVQTIMNATGESIGYVEGQLDRLMKFTDETSYSFTDMVNNIGKFTSAGIDLDSSVTAMQGISTWAAVSGAGISEASRAMYNLSQAMATGSVKLIDWKSIENANMATKEFKQTALDTAVQLGKIEKTEKGLYKINDKVTASVENFNSTLADGWLDKEVLMETLKIYGGYADDLYNYATEHNVSITDAMEKMGESTNTLGEKAYRAAQEAKTFTDAINSVKEAVSTGWLSSYQIVFGNYEEAKELWTDLSIALYDAFMPMSEARNAMLQEWKDLGGRTELINAISTAWNNILDIVEKVKDAFSEVFPKSEVNILKTFTHELYQFATTLELTEEGSRRLTAFMTKVFGVIKSMLAFLGKVFNVIGMVFVVAVNAIKTILFTVTSVLKKLTEFEGETRVLTAFGNALIAIRNALLILARAFITAISAAGVFIKSLMDIPAVRSVVNWLLNMFAFALEKATELLVYITNVIFEFTEALNDVAENPSESFLGNLINLFKNLGDRLGIGTIGTLLLVAALGKLAIGIYDFFWSFKTAQGVFGGLTRALTAPVRTIAGLFDVLKKGVVGGIEVLVDIGDAIWKVALSAQIILTAKALATLAQSFVALSKVSWDDGIKAVVFLASLSAVLLGTTAALGMMSKVVPTSAGELIKLGLSLVVISAALGIFVLAVSKLAEVMNGNSWEQSLAFFGGLALVLGVMAAGIAGVTYVLGTFGAVAVTAIPFLGSLAITIGTTALAIAGILGVIAMFEPQLSSFVGAVTGGVSSIINSLTNLVGTVLNIIPTTIEEFTKLAYIPVSDLAMNIGVLSLAMGGFSIACFITAPAMALLSGAFYLFGNAARFLADSLNVLFDSFERVKAAFGEGGVFEQIGSWIPESIGSGISKAKNGLVSVCENLGDLVEETIRNKLDIHSESPLYHDIGEWVPASVGSGMEDGSHYVVEAADKIGKDTTKTTKDNLKDVIDAYNLDSNQISNNLETSISDGVAGSEGGVFSKFHSFGWDSMTSYVEGFTQAFDATNLGNIMNGLLPNFFSPASNDIPEVDEFFNFLDEQDEQIAEAARLAKEKQRKESENNGNGTGTGTGKGSGSKGTKDSETKKAYKAFDAITDAANVVDILQGKVLEAYDSFTDTQAVDIAKEAVTNYAETVWQASLTTEEAAKISEMTTEERLDAIRKSYQKTFEAIGSKLKSQVDIYKDFVKEKAVSPSTILKNVKKNLAGVEEWFKGLTTLADKGLNINAIKELEDLGPGSTARLKGFLKMSQNQIDEFNTLYATYPKMLEEMPNKIMALNAAYGLKDTEAFAKNYGENINQMMKFASDGVYAVDQDPLEALVNSIPEDKLDAIGEYVDQGLAKGIVENEVLVSDTMKRLAGVVEESFTEPLEIHSPSEVFYDYGNYIVDGLVNALNDSRTIISNAVESLGDALITSSSYAIDKFTSEIQNGVRNGFSVAPVIDMTNLAAAKTQMSSYSMGYSPRGYADIYSPNRMVAVPTLDYMGDSKVIRTQDDSAVSIVNAITDLKQDVIRLNESMTKMQVRLDGEALVGSIVGPMDAALGRKAESKGRGRY